MALLPPSQIGFDHPRGSPAWVARAKEAKIGQMRGYVQVLHLVYVFSLFVLMFSYSESSVSNAFFILFK